MIPERWFDVTHPGLDDERLLCSNCFAATTRPRILYGWQCWGRGGSCAEQSEEEAGEHE